MKYQEERGRKHRYQQQEPKVENLNSEWLAVYLHHNQGFVDDIDLLIPPNGWLWNREKKRLEVRVLFKKELIHLLKKHYVKFNGESK